MNQSELAKKAFLEKIEQRELKKDRKESLDGDFEIHKLPHPKRAKMSNLKKQMDDTFQGIDEFTTFYLNEFDGVCGHMEAVIWNNASTRHMATNRSTGIEQRNNPLLHPFTAFKRLEKHQGPIITIDPDLYEMLKTSDISDTLPASMFQIPFKSIYLEFPLDNELRLHNAKSEEYLFEGCYISQLDNFMEIGDSDFNQFIGTDVANSRQYQVCMVGRPMDGDLNLRKGGYADDMTVNIDIVIPENVDMTLNQLMDRTSEYLQMRYDLSGQGKAHLDLYRPVVEQATKMLLFMNSNHFRREFQKPESEAKENLDRMKNPAKKRKYERKTRALYDRIYVTASNEARAGFSKPQGGVQKKIHPRRGHLRRQPYGSRNNPKYKVIFIPPTIVGPKQGVPGHSKDYEMRM